MKARRKNKKKQDADEQMLKGTLDMLDEEDK